ncbi:plastocyanin/azurin family copper-binding protein [Streptomyces sp. NPDC051554]|uniref:cupredoxin domain-containing protein n=1 Tax=Streptomyces sp. NPDC051554 TaxID=3365656 RepID=UPI003788975B
MPRLTVLRALLSGLLLTAAALVLPAAMAQAATTHQVVMSGYAFSPRSLTITAGDTVTWVNEDQAPHNVKTTSGPASVQSAMLSKGATFSHTFTTPGTYGYECTVHPGMTAMLVVQAAAAPTVHPTRHQPAASAPAAAQPATPSPRTTATASHPDHTHEAAAPATTHPPSPSSAAPAQQPVTATQDTASSTRPLDPLLLLAGVVAGVALLCLLLVGSRSANSSAIPTTSDGNADKT